MYAQILRSITSPSPVLEAMKDNLPGTDCTLTVVEKERDTTETGVKSETVTVIVIGTEETTEITATIAPTGIVCLILNATTGTRSATVTGSGVPDTLGSATVTGTLIITATTDPETMWTVSKGDTDTPTTRSLTAVEGGSRRAENLGP